MISSEFERLNRLGSGSIGAVYKVIHKPTSRVFALKTIYGTCDDLDPFHNQVREEIQILRDVDHPNLLKCHDIFDHTGELQLLLEFMDGGSLEGSRIQQEHVLSNIARQVLSALSYLHGRHIVHHEIKPSNILVDSRNNVKIADFIGASRILHSPGIAMDPGKSSDKTIAYMSPERINTDLQGGADGCTEDIWSFGVSMLEVYLGRLPFEVQTQGDWASLMMAICMSSPPEAPPSASREFREFIACCLQRDPHRRWTVKQLLQHPFILSGEQNQLK